MSKIVLKFALFICFFALPTLAFAQTVFIHNDDLKITLPADVQTSECEAELALKAGNACIKLQTGEVVGVIFYRQSEGYALMPPGALEAHIRESVAALSDIPNIEIKNARTLEAPTPLGVLELLRRDSAVADIVKLAPPITQTSILIPLPHQLGQMFIYLPSNDERAHALLKSIVDAAPKNIEVFGKPNPELTSDYADTVGILPSGTLSLLPTALLWGGAVALAIILVLHLLSRRRKKARENDET